jgi:glycosyltransferase involved in cell wall biosynthesis
VDDGSTDGSCEIIKQMEKEDSTGRIKVLFPEEHGTAARARNYGISKALGRYIAFLDADDLWDTLYLEEQVKLINEFPKAAMWGINFAEMTDGKLARYLPTGLSKKFRGYVEGYFNIKGRISDLFCSSSVVIKKEVFDKIGFFDERIKYAEDNDMWFRIIASYPVAFYDQYMVFYQFDAENRALNKEIRLRYFLPFFIDKYLEYKEKNNIFYVWINRWSSQQIRKYYFNTVKENYVDAKEAITKLDYTVLPKKYRALYKTPYFIGKIFNFFDNLYHKK